MIYFSCGKKMHYLDVKQFLKFISGLTLGICLLMLLVDFWKYPEKYSNTWRYQLKNEIKSGNKTSAEYYNEKYVSRGIYLYGENEKQ